jgi:hypothetical protein
MRHPIRRVAALSAALTAAAFLAAGCGDDKPAGPTVPVAQKPSAAAQASVDPKDVSMLNFSKCMRENGVAKFPDPGADGQVDVQAGKDGIDPSSQTFQTAEQKCRAYQPGGDSEQLAKDKENALKYAACMRANGVPKFPDPNSQGGLQMNGNEIGDPNSPAFKKALEACKNLQPGGASAEQKNVTK